jgi:ribonuclease HI
MDIKAAIEALAVLPDGANVVVTTDSEYVKNGITYVRGWMKNGWKTATKRNVVNQELLIELHNLNSRHNVIWEWIQSHMAHPLNKRAHTLANWCVPKGDGGGADAGDAEGEDEGPDKRAKRHKKKKKKKKEVE